MKRRDWTLTATEAFIIVALVAIAAVVGVVWYTIKHLTK